MMHPINSFYWLILPNPGAYDFYKTRKKRPFSGLALSVASCNIECINLNKEELLAEFRKNHFCDLSCVQETHRIEDINTPKIDRMKLDTRSLL